MSMALKSFVCFVLRKRQSQTPCCTKKQSIATCPTRYEQVVIDCFMVQREVDDWF